MVGGYQLISLKDYVFDLSGSTHSQIKVNTKDIEKFKILFNINKPIICKDITIKYGENLNTFNNIIIFKSTSSLVGILYDFVAKFDRFGLLEIYETGEDIFLKVISESEY